MSKEYIEVESIDITPKGIKIAYIDDEGDKTLFTPEPARKEFYDAAIRLGKEALLLVNLGALNKKEIREPGELENINRITVEKLSFSTVKDVGAVATLRISLWLKGGVGTTFTLEKMPYVPFGGSPFSKAIMNYKEEAKKYLEGERAQKSLFEEPEKDAKREAANG